MQPHDILSQPRDFFIKFSVGYLCGMRKLKYRSSHHGSLLPPDVSFRRWRLACLTKQTGRPRAIKFSKDVTTSVPEAEKLQTLDQNAAGGPSFCQNIPTATRSSFSCADTNRAAEYEA